MRQFEPEIKAANDPGDDISGHSNQEIFPMLMVLSLRVLSHAFPSSVRTQIRTWSIRFHASVFTSPALTWKSSSSAIQAEIARLVLNQSSIQECVVGAK